MKISFSTIGCPTWTPGEVISTAKDLGYNGIEVRCFDENTFAPKMKCFNQDLDKTIELLKRTGIEISMLSSSACLANHNDINFALDEAKEYVLLAQKLKVPFIRVMSTSKPYYDGGDIELCKKQYAELLDFAKDTGVTPLMETNGIFVDTKKLATMLDELGEGGGALWDIHHPFRYNDESVAKTIENLSSHIKYCHLKDSLIEKGKVSYKMMGYGDIPLEEAILMLNENKYDGYFTLEWVKMWDKCLEDGGVVFAQYSNFMKAF